MLTLPNKSTDVWALADCDSFFASCEVARNPALQGKEVCVCREHDIVVACTYEAKRKGVSTGTPSREARRLLSKDAVYIKPDMGYYGRVSAKLFGCLAEYGEALEQFSIDEAFLLFPPFGENDEISYHLYALYVQQQLFKRTGIGVTFGVAPTRLLAKTFSKIKKPFGVFVGLDEATIHDTLKTLDLTKTPFIGERTASKVWFCKTMYDFMRSDGVAIRQRLGWSGLKLWLELNGVHALQIERQGPQTIISRCRSFHPDFTNDQQLLWEYLMKNFEKSYTQLMDQDLAVAYLHVFLTDKAFSKYTAKIRLPRATTDKDIILQAIKKLFAACYQPNIWYRQTGIILAELVTSRYKQYSVLFQEEELHLAKQKKIYEVIEQINKKQGKQIVRIQAG